MLTFLPTSGKVSVRLGTVIYLDLILQIHERGVNVRVVASPGVTADTCGSAEILPAPLPFPLAFVVVVQVFFESRVVGRVPQSHWYRIVDAGPA